MVTVFSNTNSEPACLVSRLKFGNDNNVDNVQFQRLGWLIPQRGKEKIPFPEKFILQLAKSKQSMKTWKLWVVWFDGKISADGNKVLMKNRFGYKMFENFRWQL